jgi:hypothetical protein
MGGFMSLFLKFRYGRWDQIRMQLKFKCSVDELKMVGQVAIEWLINAVHGDDEDAEFLRGLYERELAEIGSQRRMNLQEVAKGYGRGGSRRRPQEVEVVGAVIHPGWRGPLLLKSTARPGHTPGQCEPTRHWMR